MNDNTNRSDLNNNTNNNNNPVPSIIVEDYSTPLQVQSYSGEQTPVSSSYFGSIASDEQSVTSSQSSRQHKLHLTGSRLRSRLKALMRSKSDKYESKTYQGNKNTAADNVDPAAYSSSATITGYYAGKNESEIKSMNYDTLPPLPKFHETTPEYYSENEKKYTNGRDVEDGNDNDDGNDDNDSSMKSLIKGFQSTSLSSNNTNLSKYRTNQNRSPLVKQFSVPKHHADPLYEKHHIVLEEKALTNTAGNAGQHSHHSHHHHHHHHHGNHHHHHHHHGHSNKTRSSRILSPSSTKSLQPKDANNQPEDKEDSVSLLK
ncbi:unnamed protein product [Trichobilharzia regenti]|nr:unnamed protein product [Trichobilharzia regenti]